MPDEQAGFGPAALENPEADSSFATKEESLAETPAAPESEPTSPEKSGKYEQLLSTVTQAATPAVSDTDAKVDLDHLQTFESEEEKIEELVKLAQTKGVVHAVQVATRLKDYYALDMFHDELVDNLYDALLAEGLITKE